MKKIILLIMLVLFSMTSKAQISTTVVHPGVNPQITIYMVPQGFTTASISYFNDFVAKFNTFIFTKAPYSTMQNNFKIIRVDMPGTIENEFHAFFQFENVADLSNYICSGTTPFGGPSNQYLTPECIVDYYTRMDNLKLQLPGFDGKSYIIGVFNNNYYTAGGGRYTFVTRLCDSNDMATRITLHEFSHTFGLLGDEYAHSGSTPFRRNPTNCTILTNNNQPWDGQPWPNSNGLPIDYSSFPLFQDRNVTDKTSLATIPWNFLITQNPIPGGGCPIGTGIWNGSCTDTGIGLFDGANYSSDAPPRWYKPTSNCYMGEVYYADRLCPVCVDLVNERIHEHLCPTTNNVDPAIDVNNDFTSRHQYITHWRKASNSITSNTTIGDKISVNFVSGNSILLSSNFTAKSGCDFRAYIGDCSIIPLVNTYKVTSASSPTSAPSPKASNLVSIKQDDLKIAPVPSKNRVDISVNNQFINNISLSTQDGKLIYSQKLDNPEYYSLDISNYASGTYILSIQTNTGETISKKIIKE